MSGSTEIASVTAPTSPQNAKLNSRKHAMKYANIANRVFNTPLLCTETYANQLTSVLLPRILGSTPSLEIDDFGGFEEKEREATEQKIAVIPIMGSLCNRSGRVRSNSTTMRSYHGIRSDIERAMADDSVSHIVLDVDSPGGEAGGARECAEYIAESAKQKPIYAVAEGQMCSAAFYLCAGASKIYATKSSQIGSIGAVVVHMNLSEQLKQEGAEPTVIKSGKYKDMMSPLRAMTKEEVAQVQSEIDHIAGEFTQFVASSRDLEAEDIRDLEAGVLRASKARKEGLIDGIKSIGQLVSELQQQRGETMPTAKNEGGPEKASLEQIRTDAYAMGYDEGRKAGALDAKKRMNTVLALPEAEGREEMALALALETDTSAEVCALILSKAPTAETTPAPVSPTPEMPSALTTAMATQQEDPIAPEEPVFSARVGGEMVDLSNFKHAKELMDGEEA